MAQEYFDKLHEAVKQAESRGQRFDEKGNLLTSPKGAQGEMQVMPKTARKPGYGVAPAQDKSPDELARVGKDYLKAMLDKYGDTEKALIAYNWGPKNADDWLAAGADPAKLPKETQGYIKRVTNSLKPVTSSTPAVEKEPLPASLPPMAGTPAIPTTPSSGLGTGYQAALALSFLDQEKDDKEDDDERDSGTSAADLMAQHKSVNHFANLDVSYSSPFEQPQRFAVGGTVGSPTAVTSSADREYLNQMKAYNSAATNYQKNATAYYGMLRDSEGNPIIGSMLSGAPAGASNMGFFGGSPANSLHDISGVSGYSQPVYQSTGDKFRSTTIGGQSVDKADPRYEAARQWAASNNLNPATLGYFTQNIEAISPSGRVAYVTAYDYNKGQDWGTQMKAPTAPTTPVNPVTGKEYSADEATARVALIKKNLVNKQTALNVAQDPASYGLSMSPIFKDGGEVQTSAEDLAQLMPNMEEESPPPFMGFKSAHKQTIGNRDLENMMMGLGTDCATLGINLSKMRQDDKENLAQSLMAAYRQQMGDVSLNANMIRPVDAPPGVYMGALNAGIPVGNRDQLMVGINGMRTPDESRITGYNVGYSGEVGPGRLNVMMGQQKGNASDRNYQLQYQIPLRANGGPVYRADGSPETGEINQLEVTNKASLKSPDVPVSRSASELKAYTEALNPAVKVLTNDLGGGVRGSMYPSIPDMVRLDSSLSPGEREITLLHEVEHSMDAKGGDLYGRPEFAKMGGMDNNYRAYYLMGGRWDSIAETVKNMVDNREKLEKFFGRPLDNAYFQKQLYDNLEKKNNETGLFSEQLASLSALEQTTGKFLTQDPEMRKLFPNYKMMAVYDALTGPRQTRMDARDLPPHTPVPSYTYSQNPVSRALIKAVTGKNEYGMPSRPFPIKRAGGSPEEGEVATPYLFSVPTYAETVAYEMYPGQQGQFDHRDAARHMLAAGTLTRKYGDTAAQSLGNLHEIKTSPFRWIGSKLGVSEMPVDYEQDLHNNRIGIELGKRSKSQKDLEDLVMQEIQRAKSAQTQGLPWIGKPVKRADGSPMGGENVDHLTPQEIERMAAAQRPAFLTPSSGRGRQAGNISKALASGEAYPAIARGVAETPYNVAGGFADIGNLALMPFGLDSKEPTLGSAHLKRLALEQNIRYPEETNPTLQGFRTAGELGSSLVNPGPIATRVGQAVEKGVTGMGREVGKQILRGIEGEGPLAAVSPPVMYAIKPRGGVFVGQTERQPVMDPFHNVHPPAGMDNVFGITGTGPRPIKEVFTDDVTKYIRGQLGTHNTDLNNWLESKLGKYMRTEMATETDPFVRATDQGKKLHLHQNIDTVKEPFYGIENVRYQEGLPKEGFAKTPLGKKVEDQIDSSIYALRMEDLIPGNLHPSMQKLIDTDPQRPAYEIAPDLSDRMQLDKLTEGMYEMLSNTKLLKYGTEGTPIPEEYLLTPEKLKGLSPVQASEKVALFNKWKEGVVQEQAANYLSKYGPVSKQYDNGRKWVSMDDLEGEPQQQELVKQAGCLGGWCTKDEDVALRYGSGDQRLSILFDEKGMPRAQLTVKTNPATVDDFINQMDDVEYSELVKTYQNSNGDLSFAMVSHSPEYLGWARSQDSQTISEIKGFDNVSNIAETAKTKPYLKEIQDFVRSKNWDNVANLSGIDMRDLTSVASWPEDKVTFARNPEFLDTVKRLNGGSLYVPTDEIDTLLDRAVKETKILPRATGGMVERQPNTARYI